MKTMFARSSIAPLALIAASTLPAAAAPVPNVRIESGMLRGTAADGVTAFKGIPFAAPPVGPLRWRPPVRARAWRGVRDASRYGHDCMQKPFPSDAAPLGTEPAEDCLYANVWRPNGGGRDLPVLVWIYGGGFVNGGASPPTYSGAELARRGIVFVSFNYRLGRFGTFAHPGLRPAADEAGRVGNYGYMDQVAALEWVHRNIVAFGGDPDRVTVVGESAGGISVHALLVSPLAKGLFARAVIQSGGPNALPAPTLAEAREAGAAFGRTKGIAPDDPDAAAKLRALRAADVVDGLNLTALFAPKPGAATFTGPIGDADFPADPLARYAAGRFAHVPLMVGATSDDIGGPDGVMARGAGRTAAAIAAQGVPVYRYRFSYVATSAATPSTRGAAHATDIPFFFATERVKYGDAATARDAAAATLASGYLVNLVKTGDPNGAGLPEWPRYTDGDPMLLDLTATGGAVAVRPRE